MIWIEDKGPDFRAHILFSKVLYSPHIVYLFDFWWGSQIENHPLNNYGAYISAPSRNVGFCKR